MTRVRVVDEAGGYLLSVTAQSIRDADERLEAMGVNIVGWGNSPGSRDTDTIVVGDDQ